MIENRRDQDRTKLAYVTGEFTDPKKRSYYSIAGHRYVAGQDVASVRVEVLLAAQGRCAICRKLVWPWDADVDHKKGGNKYARCDCFETRLANGSICTNLRLVHGMDSTEPCHRLKHHRCTSKSSMKGPATS